MAPLSGPASSSGSSRWQLSSIRVRGFKSFGPSWVTVPLPNTNLVGILGPNGSGKSNLLEAVLFAVGCPATSLRVRTLRELASSDAAHAPCEVELTIQRQAAATVASSAGGGGGRRSAVNKGASASASTAAATPPLELHTLRTSLAPDGASRLYQLDGRNRTAQQVKDFLAPRGMALDSGPGTDTSPRVIRQAQVTALADSNDSTALAALIGSASGLVRWRDETRRGSQELEVTRGSLREIRTHLETLQTAVRDDEERLAAASRLASLETEIAAVGGELGAALERWVRQIEDELAACERRESDGQDEIRRLEEAAAAAEVQHQHLVSELEKLLADDAAAAAAVAVAAGTAAPAESGGRRIGFGAAAGRQRRGSRKAAADAAPAATTSTATATAAANLEAPAPPTVAVAALEQQLAVEVEKVRLWEQRLAEGRQLRDAVAAAAARHTAAAADLARVSEAADREAARLEEVEAVLEEVTSSADAAAAAAQYHEHLRAAAVESTAEAAAARERLAAATADVRHLEVLLAEARSETSRLAGAMMASQQYGRDSGAAAASMCGAADAAAAAAASEAASAAAAAADAATATADTAASAVRSTQRQLSEVRARADALRRALQLPPRPPSPLQHQHQPPPPPQVPYRRLYQCFTLLPRPPQHERDHARLMIGDADGDGDGDGDGWAVRPWPPYLHALSVIAGGSMQVVVCDTAATAAHLADNPRLSAAPGYGNDGYGGGKLRLWPLDRLRCTDMTGAQRRAQMELAAQGLQAWLPLDLLRFSDPRVAPALLRAFGRQMVAADDAAAAALATRFGLSSVTLAGSVSHRGMLTGGWDGGGGGGGAAARGRQLWERLWELSELIRLEGRLAVLLSQQQGALAAAERRRGEAEAAALEAVAAEEQARAVQHRIQNLDEQLSAAQQAQHTAAAAATAAELEEAQHREALMHHCGSGTAAASGGGVVQSGVRDGLVAEVTALRARVEELEAARSAALLSVEAAEAEEEAAEARAAGVLAEEVAEARLRERRRLVQDLERSLQEAKEAVAAAALRRQELEASAAIAAVRTADLQAQLRGRRGALRAERESLAAGRAALKRVGQERDAIRREYGSMYAGGDDGGSGGERAAGGAAVAAASEVATKRQVDPGQRKQQDKDDDPERAKDGKAKGEEEKKAEKGAEEDCEKAAAVLRNQLRTLRLERGRLGGSHVSPAQLLQFQERVAAVAVLRERANSLATAADMLQAAIEQSADQVLAANTAVFNAVRRRFVSLCGRLLPSLDLDLTAPYGCASRGVVVRFRRHNRPDRDPDGGDADGTEADGGSRGGWTEELGQLSGGQRTLVSVALLLGLALALSGGGGGGNSDGGGGLFLLDEVDAALDEHNQAAVAALLRYLSHRGGGCQVLAVTHNAAFQTACNGFVRLTRGPAGTQLEMPGAAGAIAAPHLAAAGPGNGAAAGWGIGGSRGGGSGGGDCGTGGAGGVAGVPAAKKLRTARPRRV